MGRKHIAPALSVVLANHMDRISELTCSRDDAYPNIKREVRFFVAAGRHEYLDKNTAFKKAWHDYQYARCPMDQIVQEWQYEQDMTIFEIACGIYTNKGAIMRTATPWDTPFDAEEDDTVEVAA